MTAAYQPLETTAEARTHSRNWFSALRAAVIEARQPYVLSNAEMPHEIFETLGLPVVTGEWWGGVISAKQKAGEYLDAINARGFHKGLGAYNTLGLVSTIIDIDDPPWGGLPPPSMIAAPHREQSAELINGMVAEHFGIPYVGIEMPAAGRFHPRWWELIRDRWEELYETERIDLLTAQYHDMIAVAETVAGRRLDVDALRRRLETVNAQEEYFDEARDLILTAPACPVRMSEQMSNVMTAQWHRGSQWALDHAHAFRDEVAERVRLGRGVVAREKVRLMWGGVGLWQNTRFYNMFEDSHGAVFVWSMYLALAADAYIKYGLDDPVRALAARYLHVGELAHAPPWAGNWMVHEAKRGRIDGCVLLSSPGQRHQLAGNIFQKQALETAGIPVLELSADPNDNRSWDEAAMRARITQFIEERVTT